MIDFIEHSNHRKTICSKLFNDCKSRLRLHKGRFATRIDEMKKARIEKISAETQDDYRPWTLAAAAVALGYAFSLFGLRFVPW